MPELIAPYYGVPHDIRYYLDSALEAYYIPLDVYVWATTFCPNITKLIDEMDEHPRYEHFKQKVGKQSSLVSAGLLLEHEYLEWQQKVPTEYSALCLGAAIKLFSLEGFVKNTLGPVVESKRSSFPLIKIWDDYVRYETDEYRVYDAVRYARDNQKFALASLKRIVDQWNSLSENPDFSEYRLIRERYELAPNYNHQLHRQDLVDLLRGQSIIKKPVRKALKRSSELLDDVAGQGTTSLFLSGKRLVVSGRKYDFHLTKDGSIAGSHGACRTVVYQSGTDNFVAQLCVYTDKVTVFDHLASIVLHCQAGLEDEIINQSNLISVSDLELLPDASKRKEIERRELNMQRLEELEERRAPLSKIDQIRRRLSDQAKRQILKKVVAPYEIGVPRPIINKDRVAQLVW